mgnify:FL=1
MSNTLQRLSKAISDIQHNQSNEFGWIFLTGSNINDVKELALKSVQIATPDNIHTEECSILSAPRKGETWSDIVLESTFRSAVQNASVVNDTGTGTGTGTGTTKRLAILYLWQFTDFFMSKRNSENWRNHVCIQDSDRAARKFVQCHTQLKMLQRKRGVRVIVIATASGSNPDVLSKLLPSEIQSCFRYHMKLVKVKKETDRTMIRIQKKQNQQQRQTNNITNATNNAIDWGDVVGMEAAKQSLLEAVVWSRTRAHEFYKLGVRPSKGILLYGPPGTGKTLVARTVAEKANVTFLSMSFAEIIRSGVGESELAIAVAFDQARRNGPSVLFIDEIQALFSERKDAGGVAKKMTSQLLQEIDGLTAQQILIQGKEDPNQNGGISNDNDAFSMQESHVVVLAATNLPQALDPALLRPGRFDKLIHVGLPNEKDRAQIFRNLLQRSSLVTEIDVTEQEQMCHCISQHGTSLTGAEIENIYRIAVGFSISAPMNTNDIMKAIDIVRKAKNFNT